MRANEQLQLETGNAIAESLLAEMRACPDREEALVVLRRARTCNLPIVVHARLLHAALDDVFAGIGCVKVDSATRRV